MKVFIEEQRFMQSWILLVVVLTSFLPITLAAKKVIESDGQDQSAIIAMIIVTIVVVLVFVLILFLRLRTRIDERGIAYRFIPFHFHARFIPWNEIQKAHVRKYNPISEYGGWGIKGGVLRNKKKGIAYNVSGNIGIQLVLKNGKKVLIGTQKEHQVKSVLVRYQDKVNNNENQ